MNDNEKTISIFQEWVPGSVTTLLVNFGPFSDRRIAGYTKQILQGLVYLHSERVIHRDIKGGNILIDDRGVVKLCDFGASKVRGRSEQGVVEIEGERQNRRCTAVERLLCLPACLYASIWATCPFNGSSHRGRESCHVFRYFHVEHFHCRE